MDESSDYLTRISEDEIEDHILFLVSDRIECLIVVVMFPAQVDLALAVGVIVDAIAACLVLTDIERQIFVERITVCGPEAHGIIGIEPVTLMILVDPAGLVSQAIDTLTFFSSGVMNGTISQFPVKIVGQTVAVLIDDPFVIADGDAKVLQPDPEIKTAVPETDSILILKDPWRTQIETFQRQLVPAFVSQACMAGIDAESWKKIFLPDQSHPEHVPDEVDAHGDTVTTVLTRMIIGLIQLEMMIELHALGSPFCNIFLTILK
jgi:hypothetical protein